ncbi:hypothetical protein BJ508DRAFT_70497 [Ascobolus immersus RN42]|uniref:Nitrogen regulatory protein areA GATA-like domain-containing protein n=1 Tax=Ascobolus immersus RN42 TaxID=1160509 RepID=A0A3N4ICU3_ASCIM|nr:hypothetical protein BJ508DRAFT_70497 [Ascobolus immersus RN42]
MPFKERPALGVSLSDDVRKVAAVHTEELAKVWRFCTANKEVIDKGRRYENLFWRVWASERLQKRISGHCVATIFMTIAEGEEPYEHSKYRIPPPKLEKPMDAPPTPPPSPLFPTEPTRLSGTQIMTVLQRAFRPSPLPSPPTPPAPPPSSPMPLLALPEPATSPTHLRLNGRSSRSTMQPMKSAMKKAKPAVVPKQPSPLSGQPAKPEPEVKKKKAAFQIGSDSEDEEVEEAIIDDDADYVSEEDEMADQKSAGKINNTSPRKRNTVANGKRGAAGKGNKRGGLLSKRVRPGMKRNGSSKEAIAKQQALAQAQFDTLPPHLRLQIQEQEAAAHVMPTPEPFNLPSERPQVAPGVTTATGSSHPTNGNRPEAPAMTRRSHSNNPHLPLKNKVSHRDWLVDPDFRHKFQERQKREAAMAIANAQHAKATLSPTRPARSRSPVKTTMAPPPLPIRTIKAVPTTALAPLPVTATVIKVGTTVSGDFVDTVEGLKAPLEEGPDAVPIIPVIPVIPIVPIRPPIASRGSTTSLVAAEGALNPANGYGKKAREQEAAAAEEEDEELVAPPMVKRKSQLSLLFEEEKRRMGDSRSSSGSSSRSGSDVKKSRRKASKRSSTS